MNIILIVISFVLGILAILYLRRYDIYEKEPFSIMIATTFFGGFVAIGTTTLFYKLIGLLGYYNFESIYGAFVFIGPIEEFSKLIAMFMAYFIFKKFMDEPVDGLIYMSCIVLGFSLIENYSYAIKKSEMDSLIFTRLFIATPAHLLFSIFMGFGFYKIKKENDDYRFLLGTFIYASFAHGIWDAFIFSKITPVIPILILGFSYKFLIYLLETLSAKSPYRTSLKEFITRYENPIYEEAPECIKCSSQKKKLRYELGKIKIYRCDNCGYYLSSMDSMFSIFQHFASLFRNLNKYYFPPNSKVLNYAVLLKHNLICERRKIAIFDLDILNNYTEAIINNFRSKGKQKDLLGIEIDIKENYDDYMNSEDILINKAYDPLVSLQTDNLQTRLEKYYTSLQQLPDEINCPNCFSILEIDDIKKKERSFECPMCEEKLNLQKKHTEMDGLKNYILNFKKPKIPFGQKMKARLMLYNINRFRNMRRLPNEINCPKCFIKIKLNEKDIIDRTIKCNGCNMSFDLRYKKIIQTIQ
jgi:RsiW-degrading membrane proteinase PrsW (M82 family)